MKMDNIQDAPPELQEMLMDYYIKYGEKKYTTDFWVDFNNLRIGELLSYGYDKFKHTVANQYCMWLETSEFPESIKPIKSQLDFLVSNLSKKEISNARELALKLPVFSYRIKEFNLITLLLWQYVKNQGLEKELASLSEPSEGSPPAINFEDRLISQDIANSLLELDTIFKYTEPGSIKTILEIGAGYGRNAYVWLTLGGVKKYLIVDIPPALYISQRYLSNQFPSKKVFKYRDFKSFDKVEEEYNQADLVFLMPWQMEMLPEKSIDLICAIDSLYEINIDIIKLKPYFKIFNNLARKYFYMKAWKVWESENGTINQNDYPIPTKWKCLLNQECRVQTDYFESLYRLPYKK